MKAGKKNILWMYLVRGPDGVLATYKKFNKNLNINSRNQILHYLVRLLLHTTNLNAQELENLYGNRVRSSMRQLFNLIAFDQKSIDKRK